MRKTAARHTTAPDSEIPEPRRLNIRELEARLHVGRSTIARWIARGAFPTPHYLGEWRQWYLHEIEAWEAARAARPPQERALALSASQALEARLASDR